MPLLAMAPEYVKLPPLVSMPSAEPELNAAVLPRRLAMLPESHCPVPPTAMVSVALLATLSEPALA